MPVDKSRVKHTPCITIEAGEWFRYPGWEDFLCQESVATYADQEELVRNRYNRRKGYDREEYFPSEYHDVFMWAAKNKEERDGNGRPLYEGDIEWLEEACPQAWNELVDLLLEVNFDEGVIRLINNGVPINQENKDG